MFFILIAAVGQKPIIAGVSFDDVYAVLFLRLKYCDR